MNTRKVVPGLADRLRVARSAAGLSQAAAGEKGGVHPISIAKFETEKTVPTLDVLYRLAAAYGVTVCSLLPDGEKLPEAVEPESDGKKLAARKPARRKPGGGT